MVTLVLSRLDYGNSLLVGLSSSSAVDLDCSHKPHRWSATWDPQATPLTHLLAFIGWSCQRGSSIRSLCWRTKSYGRGGSAPQSLGALARVVDQPGRQQCAQPALVACWYHPSGSQQSAAGSFQLLVPMSGTPCQKHNISTITDDFMSTSDNLILVSSSDLKPL